MCLLNIYMMRQIVPLWMQLIDLSQTFVSSQKLSVWHAFFFSKWKWQVMCLGTIANFSETGPPNTEMIPIDWVEKCSLFKFINSLKRERNISFDKFYPPLLLFHVCCVIIIHWICRLLKYILWFFFLLMCCSVQTFLLRSNKSGRIHFENICKAYKYILLTELAFMRCFSFAVSLILV